MEEGLPGVRALGEMNNLGPERGAPAAGGPARFDFDEAASTYDDWYRTPAGRLHDRLQKHAVAKMLPSAREGRELLEVGCGTGHWSKFFSASGFAVVGVDLSPAMVERARQRGLPEAAFLVADAHALPLRAGGFDVAAAMTTLEFVAAPEQVLAQMVRGLRRPGGTLLLGVLNARALLNLRRRRLAQAPYHAAHLFSAEELEGLLAPYGSPDLQSVDFLPGAAWARGLAGFTEWWGRRRHCPRGALLLARLQL